MIAVSTVNKNFSFCFEEQIPGALHFELVEEEEHNEFSPGLTNIDYEGKVHVFSNINKIFTCFMIMPNE